jgi:hypothetical protein
LNDYKADRAKVFGQTLQVSSVFAGECLTRMEDELVGGHFLLIVGRGVVMESAKSFIDLHALIQVLQ